MEHAKKMFLVDLRFDFRNESRHHSALDKAISSVLNADLPKKEKQLQYDQALHRYRTYLTNIESAASEPIKVQPTVEGKSVKDKIIEAVGVEVKAKALKVYDDLSAYTPLTVDKQGRMIQDGTIGEDSNLVNPIAHGVKKKRKGRKLLIAWEIFSTAKAQVTTKKGQLSSSRRRSKVKTLKIMEAYNDVKAPGNYGGIKALYRLLKQRGENVTRK